ncbi:MAG: alpha/beta hydrolase [Burkholderiaceae bacterium]
MKIGTSPTLYAYTGGRDFDPALPCVVFLHGAQLDHSVWALQSRWFAHHGWAVLALDLPGHGRSQGEALTSIEAIADAIAPAIAAATAQPLLLVGHSMGSLIALEFARRLPEQTAGVALLGTSYPMKVAEALLAATRDQPDEAIESVNLWSHSASIGAFNRGVSAPGPGFSIPGQSRRLMQRITTINGAAVMPTDFAACNAYAGGLEAAAQLPCPALFVLGEADQMTPPKAAQRLIDACATATVVRLPACGHEMMAEAPEGVRRALANFAIEVRKRH